MGSFLKTCMIDVDNGHLFGCHVVCFLLIPGGKNNRDFYWCFHNIPLIHTFNVRLLEFRKSAALLMNRITHHVMPTRTLWAWLNNVFNKYDKSRVDAVGPDLACAEWLLRCGAQVRWVDSTKWNNDYNSLPKSPKNYKIEEIDATDSAVMNIGFLHLKGLTHLQKIRFHKCFYLDNGALAQLSFAKDSLKDLHISSCGNITDEGIASLLELRQMKKLHLFDLIGVQDRPGCLQLLTKSLPNCIITFPETPR